VNTLNSVTKRAVVLTTFALAAGLSQLLWLNFAPILDFVQSHYSVTESQAGLLILVFPLIYVFLSIPAGNLIDRRGYRYGINLGVLIMAAFSILRIFACNTGHDAFWMMFSAQVGISIAQPYIVNGISKLVIDWYEKEHQAMATGLGTVGMFIGMALGMAVTPPLLARLGFQGSMIAYAALSLATLFLCFTFLKENPAHKRSNAAREASYVPGSFIKLAKNTTLLKLFTLSFLGLGFFNGLTTWLELILKPYGISSDQAGIIGGLLIVGGIVGAAIVPAFSDKFKKRKPFVLIAIFFALLTVYPLCSTGQYAWLLILGVLQGFFFLPAFSLLLEMCSEVAGEAMAGSATGILMLAGNAGGVVVIMAMEAVKSGQNDFHPAVLLMVAILVVAEGLAVLLPETYNFKKARGI
jgi:MFS family permease